MNYMYDILLNFTNSKKVYEFFEWESTDVIINVKKIPIFKIAKETLWDLLNYRIKVDKSVFKKIENTSIVYKQNKKRFKHLAIFSDGSKAIGINLNDNGIVEYKSSMLLDEEEEATYIAEKLQLEKLEYQKLEKLKKEEFITRKEEEEKTFLLKEINLLYKNNDLEKLKYLYIEYFDKKEENIDNIYNKLITSLDSIDEKHEELYQLLKLTCKK